MSTVVKYVMDGVKLKWDIPFSFATEKDLRVLLEKRSLRYGTDYTLEGSNLTAQAKLKLTGTPTANEVLVIYRETEEQRLTNFEQTARFSAKDLDTEFDNVLRMISDGTSLTEIGSLRIHPQDFGVVNPALPPVEKGNMAVVTNEAGNGFIFSEVLTEGSIDVVEVLARASAGSANQAAMDARSSYDKVKEFITLTPQNFIDMHNDILSNVQLSVVGGLLVLDSSEGVQGPQGPIGNTGPTGPVGPQGTKGDRGQPPKHEWGGTVGEESQLRFENSDGSWGEYRELKGPQGPEGPRGQQGIQGATGERGEAGSSFQVNVVVASDAELNAYADEPSGFSVLVTGHVNVNGTIGALRIKMSGTSGDWSEWIPFGTGPEGPQGPRGPEGIQGAPGEQGLPGAKGPQGDVGADGAMGPRGPEGATGPTGAEGPIGPQGIQGPRGLKGEQGSRGDKGETGDKGAAGDNGHDGKSVGGKMYTMRDGSINAQTTNNEMTVDIATVIIRNPESYTRMLTIPAGEIEGMGGRYSGRCGIRLSGPSGFTGRTFVHAEVGSGDRLPPKRFSNVYVTIPAGLSGEFIVRAYATGTLLQYSLDTNSQSEGFISLFAETDELG